MERKDCMLQMDELYFSSFDFEQSREDSNTEYDVSFHIEYAKNKKDSAKFRVMIRTAVENKTGSVRIRLDTVGIFTIENFELDRDLNERILKANTVAIMFPYIRSQISLLTGAASGHAAADEHQRAAGFHRRGVNAAEKQNTRASGPACPAGFSGI